MKLTLIDITGVLGCSRATASLVRAGKYPAQDGKVQGQYAALQALLTSVRIGTEAERCESLCLACPRDDCTGCRVAEIVTK